MLLTVKPVFISGNMTHYRIPRMFDIRRLVLVTILILSTTISVTDCITFPCIAPLLGPTIPSAPSREPSPARSRTPEDPMDMQLRLTIRGGDLAVSKTPRARSESGVGDSTGSETDSTLLDVSSKMRVMSSVPGNRPITTGMKIAVKFRINYSTRWGENVIIVGSTDELGGISNPSEAETRRAIAMGKGKVMRYIANGDWEYVTVMHPAPTGLSYRYALVREKGEPLVEGGIRYGRYLDIDDLVRQSSNRRRGLLAVGSAGSSSSLSEAASRQEPMQLEVRDQWRVSRQNGEDWVLRTDAIAQVVYGQGRLDAVEEAILDGKVKHAADVMKHAEPQDGEKRAAITNFHLNVERTRVPLGCAMAVESAALLKDVAVMSCARFPSWELDLEAPTQLLPAQYKYVVVNLTNGEIVDRESGAPRWLGRPVGILQQEGIRNSKYVVSVRDEATTDRWPVEKADRFRGTGVSLPLFSLRSRSGMGTGEFEDIKLLVDFCDKVGLNSVQLLPLTDTTAHAHATWEDSSPYSSVSVHALHPLYLRLQSLPDLPLDVLREIQDTVKSMNEGSNQTVVDESCGSTLLEPLDYEKVMTAKLRLLRMAYEASGKRVVESEEFADFVLDQGYWLKPYALYCVLRDMYGVSDPSQWGEMGRLSFAQMDALSSPGGNKYNACRYWYWVQYHLHKQFLDASRYAAKKGVALIGDLPIGVSRNGVDIWSRPELFRLDKRMGAPPDAFTELGQNWNFPAYDWEKMMRDGFSWWRARLRSMNMYFHSVRLDHILGFFRFWDLPAHAVTGLGGHYFPSHPITKEELDSKGLWDRQRLTQPYVRSHLLERRFGKDWENVVRRFFSQGLHGTYSFKPGLDTEKALQDAMERDPVQVQGMTRQAVLHALILFLNDRCLIRDEKFPDDRFYPRYKMWDTDSFAELGHDWQIKLKELHDAYFSWRQEDLCEATARESLRHLLAASNMLLCGEDMGPGPACLPRVLSDMSIPGLRIPRVTGGPTSEYPYLSVASTSTHDMSTLACWWDSLPASSRDEMWRSFGCTGPAPLKCSPPVAKQIVQSILASPSILAVLPLQDLLDTCAATVTKDPKSDQINFPGTDHLWRWRASWHIEDLLSNKSVVNHFASMILASGRYKR